MGIKSGDHEETTNFSEEISRKDFVKKITIVGLASQLPWFVSCNAEEPRDIPKNLNFRQSILDILFPMEGNGPGALDCYADRYIEWVLNDELLDPDENDYIVEGFDKIEIHVDQYHDKPFEKLSRSKQEEIIEEWVSTASGEKFLSRILTLIFEAMMTHPLYGGNTDRSTWEWLDHFPGRPEPTEEIMYPQIIQTIREN